MCAIRADSDQHLRNGGRYAHQPVNAGEASQQDRRKAGYITGTVRQPRSVDPNLSLCWSQPLCVDPNLSVLTPTWSQFVLIPTTLCWLQPLWDDPKLSALTPTSLCWPNLISTCVDSSGLISTLQVLFVNLSVLIATSLCCSQPPDWSQRYKYSLSTSLCWSQTLWVDSNLISACVDPNLSELIPTPLCCSRPLDWSQSYRYCSSTFLCWSQPFCVDPNLSLLIPTSLCFSQPLDWSQRYWYSSSTSLLWSQPLCVDLILWTDLNVTGTVRQPLCVDPNLSVLILSSRLISTQKPHGCQPCSCEWTSDLCACEWTSDQAWSDIFLAALVWLHAYLHASDSSGHSARADSAVPEVPAAAWSGLQTQQWRTRHHPVCRRWATAPVRIHGTATVRRRG